MSVPPRRKSRSDNQPAFSAIILVIVMISIIGSYFFLQGEKSSNQELMNSLSEKVRVIEDKLSITNEDSIQNMQTFSDQMAFLDKEVRKLWDHRKGYLNNFRELETKSKQNQDQINTLLGRSNILDDRFDSVANKLELADDFQLKITILTDEINNLKEAIRENQEGLSAVDQYRLQNNQKLIDTLNRLNEVSRELEIIKEELGIRD
jgi:chromosome segregation ATPase|tara:strand:+ start:3241 stop:3858 length:618 start_codon:yes stop_codon:yes gene_type:complete